MVGLTHATRLDAAMCETRRPFWNWVLTSIEDSNIEFSCPAASTKHYLASRGCIHRSKQHIRGQLQRLVMNTIRVMARPERAHLTAHATKATPWQKLFGIRLRAVAGLQLRASNSGELPPRHHKDRSCSNLQQLQSA